MAFKSAPIKMGTDHTELGHKQAAKTLCRLCANRAQTLKEKRKGICHRVSNFEVEIDLIIGLQVSTDYPDAFSSVLCTRCFNLLVNLRKRGRSSVYDTCLKTCSKSMLMSGSLTIAMLLCHNATYVRYQTVTLKVADQHASSVVLGQTITSPIDKFGDLVKGKPRMIMSKFAIVGLTEAQKSHYMCPVCEQLLSLACVTSLCGHDFCSVCLSEHIEGSHKKAVSKCPVCRKENEMRTVKATSDSNPKFYQQLEVLQVKCTRCDKEESLQNMALHEYEMCHCPESHASSPDCHNTDPTTACTSTQNLSDSG